MKNPYTKVQILAAVKEILAGVLGMDSDEIQDTDSIVNDLGADSLDFVELNTTLEKKFSFSFPRKSALEYANKLSGQPDLFYSNKTGLTQEGRDLLTDARYAYEGLAVGMTLYDIFNTTTVRNLADLSYRLLSFLPESCPECGHDEAMLSPTGKAICAACSIPLRPIRGDEMQIMQVTAYLQEKSLVPA